MIAQPGSGTWLEVAIVTGTEPYPNCMDVHCPPICVIELPTDAVMLFIDRLS